MNASLLGHLLEQDGDLVLPTLSDDELAALSPLKPPEALLVPLATHAGLSEEDRAARAIEGETSLIDRGLLAEDGERVYPTDELRAILSVRESPLLVAMFDIVEGEVVRSRYAYGAGSADFVLTEFVDGGEHVFAVRSPAAAAAALADDIDQDRRAAASDRKPLVRTADDEPKSWAKVEEAVAGAERSVRLYAAQRIGEDEVRELESSLVVGSSGLWLIGGEVDLSTGDGSITARSLSRVGLEETVRTFLVPA